MSPKAKQGEVFVSTNQSWKRVKLDDISKESAGNKIIQCQYCERPAVRLDYLWPYHKEMTACAEHLEEWRKHDLHR